MATAPAAASRVPVGEKVTAQPVKAPAFSISGVRSRHRFLKLLIYGDYGVGKTYLAATASQVPTMRDILMIDAESGDLTLDAPVFEGIDTITTTTLKQVSKVHEYLQIHCKLRDEDSTEKLIELESQLRGEEVRKPKKYRTVIIDSLAEVEAYCMYQLLGISNKTRLDEEMQSPEWAEYKRQKGMMQRLVRQFRDLPLNVIMTCPRQFTQDDTKKTIFSPNLTGKLAMEVQGFMDMVGFLEASAPGEDGVIHRRLSVQPTGRFSAKCRFSAFKGSSFLDPSLGSILEAVGLKESSKVSKQSNTGKRSS